MTTFAWLVLSYGVGCLAEERGRSKWGWFLISACISPVFGILALLLVGRA